MLAALLLLAGCAASGRGGAGSQVWLEVENDLVPPSAVTVHASPVSGGRAVLGGVSPGRRRTLEYRRPAFGGGLYRFVARTGAGEEVVSTPIALEPGLRVVWSLRMNSLRTAGEERDPW